MRRSRALVLLLLLLLAGCGGGHSAAPTQALSHQLAQQLAAESDLVAQQLDGGDQCGALVTADQLQVDTIAAINAGRIPPALQKPLTDATSQLASLIQCAPTKGHGHGKGHGKHGDGGRD